VSRGESMSELETVPSEGRSSFRRQSRLAATLRQCSEAPGQEMRVSYYVANARVLLNIGPYPIYDGGRDAGRGQRIVPPCIRIA
jgi:hypothetical protein